MASEIITKDTRLFLFQVIDFALKNKSIDQNFFEKFEKEGAELSFGFARRYYKIIYEVYLRQASYNVLGIINLELSILSACEIEKAVKILQEKSAVNLFRGGWTKLVKLSMKKKKIDNGEQLLIEKDYAEDLSAESGRDWDGLNYYKQELANYSLLEEERNFENWMIENYVKNSIACEENKKIVLTLFFSLLIKKIPYAPFSGEGEIEIISEVISEKSFNEITEIVRDFIKEVPNKYIDFFVKNLDSDFSEYLEKYFNLKHESIFLKKELVKDLFFVDNDLEIKYEYEIFKKRIKGEIKGIENYSLERIVDFSLSSDQEIVDYIFQKRIKEISSIKNLLLFVDSFDENLLSKKIPWTDLEARTINKFFNSYLREEKRKFNFFLKDFYEKVKKNETWDFLNNLSVFVIHNIFKDFPESRADMQKNILVKNINKSIFFYLEENDDNLSLFFLFDNDAWYSAWIQASQGLQERLFKILKKESKSLEWSEENFFDYILEKIKFIANKWRKETEKDLEARADWEKPPFYVINLEKSLKKSFSKKVFLKIKTKMEEI